MTGPARNGFLTTLALAALLQLSACSWQTPVSANVERPVINADTSTTRGRAAVTAGDQVGIRYRYGGATPQGFDCSGLVYYAYQQAGAKVPRTAAAQYRAASPVALTDAQPGDLLFFASWRSVNHVAIYVGNNTFVHAPSRGKNVKVGRLSDPYYRKHFVAAGRLVN